MLQNGQLGVSELARVLGWLNHPTRVPVLQVLADAICRGSEVLGQLGLRERSSFGPASAGRASVGIRELWGFHH
eukprot:2105301-Rhodomonas_salina.1